MAANDTYFPYLIILLKAKNTLPKASPLPILQTCLQRSGWETVHVFEPMRPPASSGSIRLTAQQIQILALVEKGLSNVDIAQKIALKPSGVDGHLRRIFKKLDANSRCEAVAKAIRMGLI